MNIQRTLCSIGFVLSSLMSLSELSAQSTPSSAAGSGIEGSILISPVMGGPTRQGAVDAKPLPDTEFVVTQGDRVVTSFRTDQEGHFKVSLGSGHYRVVRKEKSALGSYGPFAVDVSEGKMKTVQWKCDSGMR